MSKKIIKKSAKISQVEKNYRSISEINFDLIKQNKSFDEILKIVKINFPQSKYQKTHYSWYKQRIKKQTELNLDTTHLKFSTAKIYDMLNAKKQEVAKVEKKVKKVVKK